LIGRPKKSDPSVSNSPHYSRDRSGLTAAATGTSMAAPDPGLYLITPKIVQPTHFTPLLRRALSGGDIACVLVQLDPEGPWDSAAEMQALSELVRLAQSSGAAVLLDQAAALVRQIGADGAHLAGPSPRLRDAIKALKPEHIVGAGSLETRDDAMAAGESGVDYVMFGEPPAGGHIPPLELTLERVSWWSEIFTLPCVAFAGDLDAAAALCACGADFVAFGALIWDAKGGPADIVAAARCALDG
jgi:thiamine-phosphate pyrophosphorylase